MVNGLCIVIRNRTKKPLAIALGGWGAERAEGERQWEECK
jgi:hypothetical protein